MQVGVLRSRSTGLRCPMPTVTCSEVEADAEADARVEARVEVVAR